MKKKKIFLLMVLGVGLVIALRSCDYRLWMLRNRELTFSELPPEVQTRLSNIPSCDPSIGMFLPINEKDSLNYSLTSVKTFIGPWIKYNKLTDLNKKVVYRIERAAPNPYILFENKLYIPDRYNILCSTNRYKAIYTEYDLK